MSRVHFWSYLKDDEGRPIPDARLNLYLRNTQTEATLYETRAASATDVLDQSTWATSPSGFFEFYIGDEFEVLPDVGYQHDQTFDLSWSASAHDPVSSGRVDFLQPFWQVFSLDETDQSISRDKMINNQFAYDLEYHVDSETYATNIHNVHTVNQFDPFDSTGNKMVSNSMMTSAMANLNTLLICGGEAIAVDASYGPELLVDGDMERAFIGSPLRPQGWITTTSPITKQDTNDFRFGLASFALSANNYTDGIQTPNFPVSVGEEYRLRAWIKIPKTINIIPAGDTLIRSGEMNDSQTFAVCGAVPVPSGTPPASGGWQASGILYETDAEFVSGSDSYPQAAEDISLWSSDLCNGGTATADSNGGASWIPDKAFDSDLNSYWAAGAACPNWIQYQHPIARQIQRIKIRSSGDGAIAPITFNVQASNTGVFGGEEVMLLSVSGLDEWGWWESKYWTFDNSNSYLYYRINITATFEGCASPTGWVAIADIEMFESWGSEWYRFRPEGSSHATELVSAGDMQGLRESGLPPGWVGHNAAADSDSLSPTGSLILTNAGAPAVGWLGTWAKRIEVTLDKAKFSEPQVDFPHGIHLSSSCGISTQDLTEIFDDLGANSKKIAISSDDGTTQLYGEIERWDDSNEKAVIWTKLPSASPVYDGTIYLYWDVSKVDNSTYIGNTGEAPAQQVWNADFEAVWHFNNDPAPSAGQTITESTSSGLNFSTSGSMRGNDLIDGTGEGYALSFDGTDDVAILPSAALNYGNSDTWTFELVASTTRVGQVDFWSKVQNGGDFDGYRMLMASTPPLDPQVIQLRSNAGNYIRADSRGWDTNDGDFHYMAASYNGSNSPYGISMVSGFTPQDEVTTSGGSVGDFSPSPYRFTLAGLDGTKTANMDAKYSELRASKIVRSDQWMVSTNYSVFDQVNTFAATEQPPTSPIASAGTNQFSVDNDVYRLTFYVKTVPSAGAGDLDLTILNGDRSINFTDSISSTYSSYVWSKYQKTLTAVLGSSASVKWTVPDTAAYKIDNVNFRQWVDKTGSAFSSNRFRVNLVSGYNRDIDTNGYNRYEYGFWYRFQPSGGVPSGSQPNNLRNQSNIDFTLYDGDGITTLDSTTLPSGDTDWTYYWNNDITSTNAGPSGHMEWATDGQPAAFELDGVFFRRMQVGENQQGELRLRTFNGDNTTLHTEVLTTASGYDNWVLYDNNVTITASGNGFKWQFLSDTNEPIYWWLDDVSIKNEFLPILISSVSKAKGDFSPSGERYYVNVDHNLRRARKFPIVQVWDTDLREQIRPADIFDIDKENFRIWLGAPRNITVTTTGEVSG